MTGDEVTVSVGRGGPDTIDADRTSLETQASFGIVLESRSRPAHVHCRLGGGLARIATLDQSNYYVDTAQETFVPVVVDVEDVPEPVEGTLELSTGYGAASVTIDVTVTPGPSSVDVDETLAEPRRPDPEPAPAEGPLETVAAGVGLDPETGWVLALGALAVGIAAATAAVVGGAVAFVGFLVVALGVGAAVVLLLR